MPASTNDSSQVLTLSSEEQSELIRIASLYRDAKIIILYAEEVDPTISANIQIVKELRDALDHLMRLFLNKVNPGNENGTYGLAQVDKAIGHVYRAAFDALDGTVLSLKTKINDCLVKYDKNVIVEVLPSYWEIKTLLNALCSQISENRSNKDVERSHEELFDKYIAEVEELKNAYDLILKSGPTLDECQEHFEKNAVRQKERQDEIIKKSTKASYKPAIISGIIGAVISCILTYLFLNPSNSIPVADPSVTNPSSKPSAHSSVKP